jgi:hypothetical protein
MKGTTMSTPNTKLILPVCEFSDDEELLDWLEVVRLTAIKASDEVSEDAAYAYAKLRRFCQREGLRGYQATRTARSVALPLTRIGESFDNIAGYARLSARRFEALVEAVEEPKRGKSDFDLKSRKKGK